LTPERWAQIEELFHRAAECDPKLRACLLDAACKGDEELRQVVEGLLANEENAHDDIRAAVQSGVETVSFPLLGETVSHYRIVAGLRGGGMGIVYRAEDMKLGRQVALKFLPEESVRSPEALNRFEREARSASALEHPNICPIYEFGEHEGQPFLVMQLLEGQTLRELISESARTKPPLELPKLLDISLQIVDALEAAHQHGIIHRDIKPANIFLTTTGQVKLLDFGLAKLFHDDAAEEAGLLDAGGNEAKENTLSPTTPDAFLSRTGVAMGTAGYMSPEQARGETLDARTDLFSFGLVLYEMATGQRAFQGDTRPGLYQATPVPPKHFNPRLPARLEAIIGKALKTDRVSRYQSASELRADLKAAAPAEFPWRLVAFAACVALFCAAVGTYYFWSRSKNPATLPKITQISRWNKPINAARLSPDGHAIAFSSPAGEISQVFLMLTSGGEALQLTNDEVDKFVDNFSADGKEVYYTRGGTEVWAVPTQGGSPRRVASADYILPSPDGTSFFYTKRDSPGIFRVGKSGLNEELVYKSHDWHVFPHLVFPGGNDLLAGAWSLNSPASGTFFRINLASHEAVDLGDIPGSTDLAFGDIDTVWAEPGNSILFSHEVDGVANIWKYSFRNRSLTQITFGTGNDSTPMPDPGGKGIYYINQRRLESLTAYHVHSKQSIDIVAEGAGQPTISRDAKRVMYITYPVFGKAELWTSDTKGGNKVKITAGDTQKVELSDWDPRHSEEVLLALNWAPDSFHVFFSRGSKLYIVGADGSGLRQLLQMEGVRRIVGAVWSPDQKSVYVSALESAEINQEGAEFIYTIWKWNEGSKPEKLVEKCGFAYDIDPGGKYLLAVKLFGEKTGIYEVSISERKCIPLLLGVRTGAIFAQDGRSFLYGVSSRGETLIYRQLWKDGKIIGTPQVALKLPFSFPFNYSDFSRDLSIFVYSRPVDDHADIYFLSQK